MTKSNSALRRDANNHARQEEQQQQRQQEQQQLPPQLKLVRPTRRKMVGKKRRKKEAGGKRARKPPVFSPLEERAARGIRIRVEDAEPYGWFAHSEAGGEPYHLSVNLQTRALVCVCADACFRGDAIRLCKHIIAVKLFIADGYLKHEYDPQRQIRAA